MKQGLRFSRLQGHIKLDTPMTTKSKEHNEQYRKAREEFDDLAIEEKAVFMVESAFSMLALGIESVGNVFSDLINKVYKAEEDEAADAPEKASTRKAQASKKTTRTSGKRASSSSTKKTDTDKTGE